MKPFGIIVFGHRRRLHLLNVLESLQRQGVMSTTHVWVDGYSHNQELKQLVEGCQNLAERFPDAAWNLHCGRLGIEKLMLDGLTFMAQRYEKIIVLEDDCFPTRDAIAVFLEDLAIVEKDESVYSVYGHHFETANEGAMFPRFQGWGWATTRWKLVPILSQLKAMFMMSEPDYLAWVASALTPEIAASLDVTPGRDVLRVLGRQFSWDSATALLTDILGMKHRKTSKKVIYNCGLGANSGHFQTESAALRLPPYNMIAVEEVWQCFNGPLAPEHRGRRYFGLNELDRQLAEYIPQSEGVFVEVGAYDGIEQSNSLYFERLGWRGVLIEAVPTTFERCKRNRPLATVVHAACVSPEFQGTEISLVDVGLMSLVDGARRSEQERQAWIQRGEAIQQITSTACAAPARTLMSILVDLGIVQIDLLSVDVEGYEAEVIAGLDLNRIRPRYIVVEDSGTSDLAAILEKAGYQTIAAMNERSFTRDLLFCDRQREK